MRRSAERVAYHEAGHAVAAIALRRAVKLVSIVPRGDTNGRTVKQKLPSTFRPGHDARTSRFVERDIMISLAGPVAQEKFQGHRRGLGDYDDMPSPSTWPTTSAAAARSPTPTSCGSAPARSSC